MQISPCTVNAFLPGPPRHRLSVMHNAFRLSNTQRRVVFCFLVLHVRRSSPTETFFHWQFKTLTHTVFPTFALSIFSLFASIVRLWCLLQTKYLYSCANCQVFVGCLSSKQVPSRSDYETGQSYTWGVL